MDNHQLELAVEMESQAYLVTGDLTNLVPAIERAQVAKFAHLPREGSHKFSEILDEELAVLDETF